MSSVNATFHSFVCSLVYCVLTQIMLLFLQYVFTYTNRDVGVKKCKCLYNRLCCMSGDEFLEHCHGNRLDREGIFMPGLICINVVCLVSETTHEYINVSES